MSLYSYNGLEPSRLPSRLRLDSGETRTSLDELSKEELNELGFVGPISKPDIDESIQKLEWNGTDYQIIDLSAEEIESERIKEISEKIKNIDYSDFWNRLIKSKTYKKLRASSSQSLEANAICTELISIFTDAKIGNVDSILIQKYIDILFFNFQFSDEESKELQDIFNETNLNLIYTLPDSSYLSSHFYDVNTNSIVENSPFESWQLVDGKWVAPVAYPSDGNVYVWDETTTSWSKIN